MNSWRDVAGPIIAKVIAQNRGDPKALRRALRDAYPFGERAYWPYKVWCDEVQRQLGTKPRGARSAREHAATPDLFA
jgi:hypothetical protein